MNSENRSPTSYSRARARHPVVLQSISILARAKEARKYCFATTVMSSFWPEGSVIARRPHADRGKARTGFQSKLQRNLWGFIVEDGT